MWKREMSFTFIITLLTVHKPSQTCIVKILLSISYFKANETKANIDAMKYVIRHRLELKKKMSCCRIHKVVTFIRTPNSCYTNIWLLENSDGEPTQRKKNIMLS